jgi:glycosyltransferase involved in cell wall biosynthesis
MDHQTLLQAMARLGARSWELRLIGDGPGEREMRNLAARLRIADRVHFDGYCADPAKALAAAQLFVLSSRSEALPRSILEAMRAALPVVACNVGGVKEAVKTGRTGLLVPAGDPTALSQAIDTLLTDDAARQIFGEAGRRLYEEQFRFERTVEATAAVYRQVLGK